MPTSTSVVGTGASDPTSITHGFSLNGGHLAWAMITGKKCIENRNFRIGPGWYAIGCTKLAHTGVADDKLYRGKFGGGTAGDYPGFQSFSKWKGCLVGAAYVSHSLPHSACETDFFACANYKVKNVITKVIKLKTPIHARGNFGTWPIADESCLLFNKAIQDVLNESPSTGILNTGAEGAYPPDPEWQSNTKIVYESAGKPEPKKAAASKKTIFKKTTPTKTASAGSSVASKKTTPTKASAVGNSIGNSVAPAAGADIRSWLSGKR